MVVDGDRRSITIGDLLSGVAYEVTIEPFNTVPSGEELTGPPINTVAPSKSACCVLWLYYLLTCICMGMLYCGLCIRSFLLSIEQNII